MAAIERRWANVKEAALLLSVHPMTIRDWIARGLVPAVHIGGVIRVDLRALNQQLEAQLQQQLKAGGR